MNYTIILADGTEINDLIENGNCYVSGSFVDDNLFTPDNLSFVKIMGDDGLYMEYENMVGNVVHLDDGHYIVIRQMTEDEKNRELINAKLDYIAAMTGVDIYE